MDKNEKKGIAIGAAIGAVAGVVTGILFAPKSGKETRHDIKEGTTKAVDILLAEAKKLQLELKKLIEKVESTAGDTGKKLSVKAAELTEQAKSAKSHVEEIAVSVKAGKAEDKDLDLAIQKAKAARDSLKKYLSK